MVRRRRTRGQQTGWLTAKSAIDLAQEKRERLLNSSNKRVVRNYISRKGFHRAAAASAAKVVYPKVGRGLVVRRPTGEAATTTPVAPVRSLGLFFLKFGLQISTGGEGIF